MRSFIAFLAALSLCQARPQLRADVPSVSFVRNADPHVIGGSNASPGEFPWQLSMERNSGSWSHSCGASLLNSSYGLIAAQCVDLVPASNIRVVAGLWDRSTYDGAQIININSYTMHPEYGVGLPSYSNDIAILHFATPVIIGGNVQAATLPANNLNDYAGVTCVISGWGRTDGTNNLPNILQKGSIPVITTAECSNAMTGVGGANIWDNHICVQDPSGVVGFCNGDSGGPLNCPDGGTRVVGVGSWAVASGLGDCLPSYPSGYTRVGSYLDWIAANTP